MKTTRYSEDIFMHFFFFFIFSYPHTHTHTHIYIYIYIRGSLNKFPDFFCMCTFIDSTHMKL